MVSTYVEWGVLGKDAQDSCTVFPDLLSAHTSSSIYPTLHAVARAIFIEIC